MNFTPMRGTGRPVSINGGMLNGVCLLQSQPAQGTGGVTFYNPAQFTQVTVAAILVFQENSVCFPTTYCFVFFVF